VGGDVDGHREIDALVAPGPLLVQSFVEHPPGDGRDQLGSFDLVHEAGGRQQTMHGMAPAQQCLDPGELAGHKVDLGLVMKHQLVAGDAIAQVDQQRELLGCLSFLRDVKDRVTAAGLLSNVHRRVGAAEQLGCGFAVLGKQGDANARRHVNDLVTNHEPRGARLLDLPGHRCRGRHVGRVSGQDRELVSTEPRDRIDVSQRVEQTLGDLFEHAVAVVVAERVVDLLEPIEVHHHHGALLAGPLSRRQRLKHVHAEQRAVGQAGEPVVQCLVLEPLGVGLTLGDIAHERKRSPAIAELQFAVLPSVSVILSCLAVCVD
jgi:hypothetical protein